MPRQAARSSTQWALASALFVASCAVARSVHADSALLPTPLHAADVLVYAHAHRAEIRAASAKAASASERPAVVSALPDPKVIGSIDHLPFKLGGLNWSLMVEQEFPLSGILGARKRAAEAEALSFRADSDRVALDVELDALEAFLARVEIDRARVVNDEQRTIAEQVLAATKARLIAGDALAADAVRAESDLAREVAEHDALAAEMIGGDAALNAALARPVDATLPPLEMGLPTTDPPPMEKLVALALDKRPELASMKAVSNAATATVGVMEAMYTPMAFVRVGTAYRMDSGQGAMLMIGITIPLWREKLGAGVTGAKSMVAMADADVAAAQKVIEGEVGRARAAVIAARVRYDAWHLSVVPLARKAVMMTLANYTGGQTSLVALLDAARAWRDARMEEIHAELSEARAWARLSRVTGTVKLGAPG